MKYTVRTTKTEKGHYKHEVLRDGKPTNYCEYGLIEKPPARMLRWLDELNGGKQDAAA